MAPCILEQTSLTIKPNSFIHQPPILSHPYLDFVHSLSSMKHHPVASLGQHMCHITTFQQCSHAHSLATPMLVHSGDACATSPPFACAHLCATLLPTTSHSCTPTLISTFATFAHPCSHTHADMSRFSYIHSGVHVLVRTHQAWARIQPETSYFHSYKNFLTMFCSPILSLWHPSLFVLGST